MLSRCDWRLLLLMACAVSASALNPQLLVSQYQKRNWQVEDGLPHNYVMSIRPGPGGFLLVGTDEGLARFDGQHFTPYDLDPALGLSRRWILTMITARDGSLWTGTFDGGLYQWRDGKVLRRFEVGASVFAVVEDAAGRIWASTRNGVLRTAGERVEAVRQLARPSDTAWNVLAADQDGKVWVVTSDGLFRCGGENDAEPVMSSGHAFGEVLSVSSLSDRSLAVGTSNGLYLLSAADPHRKPVKQPGVPGPAVSVLQDRDRNLWVGTWGNGLFRVSRNKVEGFGARNGMPDVFVRTLFEDADGNLWIGVRGGGLIRWKDPSVIPLGIQEGLAGEFASTVVSDNKGVLWLGTWRGGLYRYSQGKLQTESTPLPTLFFTVRALAIDSKGRPWVGNWEGITRFNQPGFTHFGGSETPYQHVSSLLFDRRGRLWVGTSDNGLFLFASGSPESTPVSHLFPENEITAMEEDGEGNVWIGTTRGLGFVRRDSSVLQVMTSLSDESIAGLSLDTKGRLWACTLSGGLWNIALHAARRLDTKAGLPHHPLYRALDDGAGSLWIGSPKGILRISVAQAEQALENPRMRVDVERYTVDDGMRTIECHRLSQPAGGRDAHGDVWFPTTRGFVRIHPGALKDVRPPPVVIEQSSVRLEPGAHNVEIPFTALEFSSPEKVQYRYRLEKFDPDWVDAAGVHTARYSGLPPGKYRFLVSGRMPGGAWSEPQVLSVTQLPAFYQTGWFYLLILVLCAGMATLIVRWRVHLVRERYAAVMAERNRIGLEWHDTLVAGFSAISLQLDAAIQRLDAPSTAARDILEVTRRMVHHYRAEARRVIWDLRDNRSETEQLADAIEGAVREATYGKNIRANVSVSGPSFEAPKDVEHNILRICQEALTNAVRHGRPKNIDINLHYTPRELRVRIADDGEGFSPEETARLKPGHFGLTVMQERARRFGGRFQLSSESGHGTVVEAAVPLEGKNAS